MIFCTCITVLFGFGAGMLPSSGVPPSSLCSGDTILRIVATFEKVLSGYVIQNHSNTHSSFTYLKSKADSPKESSPSVDVPSSKRYSANRSKSKSPSGNKAVPAPDCGAEDLEDGAKRGRVTDGAISKTVDISRHKREANKHRIV